MARPPLRIALVVETRRLDTWQARVVAAIGAVDAEIAAVHVVEPPAPAAPGSSRSRPADALRRRLTTAIDGGSTPIDVATDAAVTTDDVDGDAPFDVVLDLRPAERAAARLDARSGRWTFRFGGDDRFPPAEAFASAALGGADAVEVVLARDGVALRAGVFGLVPYALGSGIAAAVDSFTQWPAWCLQAFAQGRGGLAPFGAEPAERPAPVAAPGRGAPAASVARAARALGRKALWAEVWTVGLAEQSPASVVAEGLTDSPRWLPERGPRGLETLWRQRGFAADPFLYRGDDGQRVLFEALDYRTDRGWIAEVDVALPSGNDRTVFRNDWHWSYPYVLEHEGVTYCVPETADAGEATLHRLTADGFEPVATLLPGLPVLDPSLVLHDGRWWLFCTHRDGPLLNTALHLYGADALTGPYRPHPDNPVKLDVGSARPAGTVFCVDGTLYRPGQDCRGDYGAALVLHRIDKLSWDCFRETPVTTLRPGSPYPAGLHTLSIGDGVVAVDAKRYAFSPPLLASRVAKVVRRLGRLRR